MAVMNDEQKSFIVKELAMYASPSEISAAVKEQFGIDVPRNQVALYDPLGYSGSKVAKKWQDLFKATRKAFLKDVSAIPIAQRSYRLKQLSDMATRAKSKGNLPLAAQLMEQAAKECGDTYTNKLNLKHSGIPKPDPPQSREAVEARVAALIGKAVVDVAKPE